jgi:hypothetical protein
MTAAVRGLLWPRAMSKNNVKSKSARKINLNRETLRVLTTDEAYRVIGGAIAATNSKPYACPSSNDPTAC